MRTLALGILLLSVSCAGPPGYYTPSYPALDRVAVGETPEKVAETMGAPTSRGNGWWRSAWVSYSTEYQVWNYKGVGRVIFDRYSRTVVATEADPREPGHGGDDPSRLP
jgi:hypothetical protein